jgi:hypothetical protein
VMDRSWSSAYFEDPCQHTENGELVFSLPPDGMGGCYYQSGSAFDLTSDTLTVKVPVTPDPATSAWVYMSAFIKGPSDYKIEFVLGEGHLYLQEYHDQTKRVLADLSFVPSEHLFWRLRESAGQVFWETSADGQTFTTITKTPNPFPVTALDVELGFFNYDPLPAGAEARFDKLNIP